MSALQRIRQTTCRLLVNNQVGGVAAARRSSAAALTRPSASAVAVLRPLSFYRTFSAQPAAEEKQIIPGIGKGKTSTGIVGLKVEPDWYNGMLKKFQLLLDTMEGSDMPETCQYRIDVTKWANFVIATTKANPEDPEAIEDEVRMGQVEELMEMADDEMICCNMYIKKKFWLEMDPEGPEIDFNPDPMKDELGPDGDPRVREKILRDQERMKNLYDEDEEEDYETDPDATDHEAY
eukprot:CAMPEP_0198138088 /NCGR_PEP_ID=MMETSP1443-20131203/1512_1 /TAXON_ID=186043 /ORGANISM="Entomoneis sp., Strain CCMP2396" /LENGTH=234 /DNA_ID=CAMNT_0043799723 /DNA_START=53 /DNA_END=757 /DNA_ORIENTATION=+